MEFKLQILHGYEGYKKTSLMRKLVFEQEQGFVDDGDEHDGKSIHMIMVEGEEAVASGRMYLEHPGVYHLGRIVVVKLRRGQGYGQTLVKQLVMYARNQQAQQCVLSSQLHACAFYERLGFSKSGDVYDEQGQPHQWMIKFL